MNTPPFNVLFLCTGNSARSMLAECLLARLGAGRFGSFSAGSHPKDAPHPGTLALLAARDYDTSHLRSKSWDEFARPGAPELHFIFTVCDNAAGEMCPVWPGRPISAHWGVADPAATEGSADAVRRAFEEAYDALEVRVRAFTRLPVETMDPAALGAALETIGRGEGP
jgi:protein-tyrosine-phosphatase